MKKMEEKNYNDKKICFIICSNNERYRKECLLYLEQLAVPSGYEVEILTVLDATSMTAGYNEAMNSSDARYKIYLHQDVFIIEKCFMEKLLKVFQADEEIGMIGMVGAERLPDDGCIWHGVECGDFYRLDEMIKAGDNRIEKIDIGIREVEAVDGLLIATCLDLTWREDIFDGWDFYDISQCMEFRRVGYKIVVPAQNPSWTIHDNQGSKLQDYERYRKKFMEEYAEMLSCR